ncbi:MAG: bifunctional transaldolase/phosoglucose isomerase [Anaerolineae bacterium]|nr:bifunctional transaldolase/phosoglucose isomerase [Anaerolineae bacterium]
MTKLHELNELGQSVWIDYIRRSFIASGELQKMIDQGVRGVTSNPAIFEKAIGGSDDYDEQMQQLVMAGKSVPEIYEALAVEDIANATDLFRKVYDESNGEDGYVSLEVSPDLARDTDGTMEEARHFFRELNRPNLMIKVPATREGIPAVEQLISEGINVNITLMFSMDHYEAVVEAYLRGLERLAANGGDISKVGSVASFFVSRVDSKLDPMLEAAGAPELKGKIAVDNAKLVYQRFKELFSGDRWEKLVALGARVQRPLWASTSTKDPSYPDTLYVDTLIGPQTVNTMPPETMEAFIDHGTAAVTVEDNIQQSQQRIEKLAEIGIDLDQATEELQDEGVDKFIKPFESLMKTITEKRDSMRAERQNVSVHVGSYASKVDTALDEMAKQNIIERIWQHDHTVWRPDADEISNRLGWLDIADRMQNEVDDIQALVKDVQAAGYTHALLLGMGGSSLAPEVFRKTFGVADKYLDLAVLDSTDPGAVLAYDQKLDPAKTLFIVSTKSGGTVETLSFFKYFYNRTSDVVGTDKAGEHFIAITDPGSSLEKLAGDYHFRKIFRNDPNIGGRYSALSHFGLVPAALVGVDVPKLLDRAVKMAKGCSPEHTGRDNPAAWLGAVMGEMAKSGRDKVTLITSQGIASFGDWVEQLIAESTGKQGKGILPVVGVSVGKPEVYGDDRLFVYLHLEGDDTYDAAVDALENAGQPLVRLNLKDIYDLGGQFFLWELAVAVAGYRIDIQPFDQPNVESAKVLARKMVTAYTESGKLPDEEALLSDHGVTVYGDIKANDLKSALAAFLKQANPGDYIALQAYVTPNEATDEALTILRTQLRDKTKLATTLGYGPRFLHSTGQLHKGDAGNGLFIQITSDADQDAAIPDKAGSADSAMSFGVLKQAQVLGDAAALRENHRRVIRLSLGKDVQGGLKTIVNAL